uniref:hypothetical protein n=1 Tax=Marinobacterium profundum TaxID=1714300 RepID=UPI00082F5647|nr:hypothetical protein [Marinobacterium profundum]
MKNTPRVIGIDPDLDKSGVGITENARLVDLKSLPFFDLIEFIQAEHAAGSAFVLENVEINKPIFVKAVAGGSPESKRRQREKIAQNVGQVKAIARLLHHYMIRIGATCTLVKPMTGTAKVVKKDAVMFKRITGWQGRSNEDTRDAAMLALYGVAGGVYAKK